MTSLEDIFGPPIHTYTRAQALEDGALIDVTDLAHEYAFTIPVALTATAHADAVAWDHGATQDETGRLWDVLTMLRHAIWKTSNSGPAAAANVRELAFQVMRVPNQAEATRPRPTTLKAVSGPGDNGEHVLTIMLTTED